MSVTQLQCANALRFLAIDAVEAANSGHPGMPMGMADIAEGLWRHHLQHNPLNPRWINRDRFVLSNGHGSLLHYALLHLSGYELPMEELRQFRQLHSKTPGHPEFGYTPGVEVTTGPLGQGLASSVGFAMAEKRLAAEFNRDGFPLIDHYTYVCVGDGCLMEGISHEACSLAGTLGLGKLIVFYDDNGISIDGQVASWFSDNTPQRFDAYGWQVIPDVDGHDAKAIDAAIDQAKADTERPTLICCQTHIGFGSPNHVDTAKVHGAPLGSDEIALVREQLNWPHEPFEVPDAIRQAWDARSKGSDLESQWDAIFAQYEQQHPLLAAELLRRHSGELPESFADAMGSWIATLQQSPKPVATRKASLACIEQMESMLPELWGGSADLSGSNCTLTKSMQPFTAEKVTGQYMHYGVREFGMAAIMNGMALHGGFIPFGGTFLVFSDYARNAIRLSAMMQTKVVYVLTHDSIGLGEDGPTHQPIEHIASLRLIPGLHVWRPADGVETAVAWRMAVQCSGPSCLLLSRQTLQPTQSQADLSDIERGAYVVFQSPGEVQCLLMASGSEVELAIVAASHLQQQGVAVRVVSVPCLELFAQQPRSVQDAVMPPGITARVAIEAGVGLSWAPWVGDRGQVMSIEEFGLSAPFEQVYNELGLTVERVIEAARAVMAKQPAGAL